MASLLRALLATGLGVLAAASAGDLTPQERYGEAVTVLLHGCRGNGCDFWVETPQEQAALNAVWQATQDWTVDWLNNQPDLTLEARRNALLNWRFNNLNDVAPASIDPLAPGLYAVSSGFGEMGNVFFVARREGRWQVVWDIRNADPGRFPVLKAWRTGGTCGDDDDRLNCGPIFGGAMPLKADVDGHLRFAIHATYAQFAGETVAGQISFWRWDGIKAEPLTVGSYAYMIDDPDIAAAASDTVVIRVKDEFKSFQAGGSGVGRQLDWTFRILPDRIVDDGKKPVVPELDTIDALLQRIFRHKPTADLARPAAAAALRAILGPEPEVDMEMDREVNRAGSASQICLSGLGLKATVFTLERRATGYFISSIRAKGTEECIQHPGK